MRPARLILVTLVLSTVLLSGAAPARAAVGDVTEFAIHTLSNGEYDGIAPSRDGSLWFTEHDGNKIGRITPDGSFQEFSIPTTNAWPWGITQGPDGNMWFSELSAVASITPDGAITEYPLGAEAFGITAGPDGALWFTELGRIGRITTSGALTQYPLPPSFSSPLGITVGPDGNLWFTDFNGSRVGQITPSGVVTDFPLPTAQAGPTGIVAGPDGNLWFTEKIMNKVGRITPTGEITEFSTLPLRAPRDIALGADGNLWFTSLLTDSVAQITSGGVITSFTVPLPGGTPEAIAAGPDGNLWFTDAGDGTQGEIGRITDAPVPSIAVRPRFGPPGTSVQVMGSGFGAFERVVISFVDGAGGTTPLAVAHADATGAFRKRATFPLGATGGRQGIQVVGRISSLIAARPFTVT